MRRLNDDSRGDIPGLPLEMMILAVVMVITIPTIWSFAGFYAREQTESNIIGQLEYIVSTARNIGDEEMGSTRIIDLDLSGHPLASVDYIAIGGDSVHELQNIRYSISGRDESDFWLGELFLGTFENDEPFELKISEGKTSLSVSRTGRIYNGKEIIEIGIPG